MRKMSSPILVRIKTLSSGDIHDSPTMVRPSGNSVVDRLPTTLTPSISMGCSSSMVTFGCGGGVRGNVGAGSGDVGGGGGGGGGCGIIRCAILCCVSSTHCA